MRFLLKIFMTCKIFFLLGVILTQPPVSLGDETFPFAYNLQEGDILTFKQVYEAQNQVFPGGKEIYHLVIEGTVKAAVLKCEEGNVHLAVQYNRNFWNLVNRETLVFALGEERVRYFSSHFDSFDKKRVQYVLMNDHGKILNGSAFVNEVISYPLPIVNRMLYLPENPLKPGSVFTCNDEENMKITFTGMEKTMLGEHGVFTGEFPGCFSRFSFDKGLGLPAMLSFTAKYNFFDRDRNEKYFLVFENKKNCGREALFQEPGLTESLLLACLRREDLTCPAGIIETFLDDPEPAVQTLAVAVCSRQGFPAGYDASRFLNAAHPLIRFNAAKGIYLHEGKTGPMESLLSDNNAFIRLRADRFLKRSLYVLPKEKKALLKDIGEYIYGKTDEYPMGHSLEDIQAMLPFVRPQAKPFGEVCRFIDRDSDGTVRPFFFRLPRDYDPAEVYPLLIYLGGGAARSDRALANIAGELKTGNEWDHFILLAPQAGGMWWDKETALSFIRVFSHVLESLSVDTDRIYLTGVSNGAMGSFFYATHYPDLFPAIAPLMGHPVVKHTPPETEADREVLENLRYISVYMAHGGDDKNINPYGDRRAAQILKRLGYAVEYEELPGRGHDLNFSEFKDKILELFSNRQRVGIPKKVTYVQNLPLNNGCFWIAVDEAQRMPARVEAEVNGNHIEIKCGNVKKLSVFLHQELVDLEREVDIFINGREVYRGIPEPSIRTLLETARERKDPGLAYPVRLNFVIN